MTDRSKSLSGADLGETERQASEIAAEAGKAATQRRANADKPASPDDPGEQARIADDLRTAEEQARLAHAERMVAEDLRDNAAEIRRTGEELRTTREKLSDNAEELSKLDQETKT